MLLFHGCSVTDSLILTCTHKISLGHQTCSPQVGVRESLGMRLD